MSSLSEQLDGLALAPRWTYRGAVESGAEPAAWAAAALVAHGEIDAAARPAQWLAEIQQPDGSVGLSETETEPRWPTSLALLAWQLVGRATGDVRFQYNVDRAVRWSLANRGNAAPRSPLVSHNPTLVGWSWAADTVSWLEPTCYFILGLTSAGLAAHPRVCEGLRLVADRLLPDGGANYGNTIVFGQQLLPHIAPTGVSLSVLGGQHVDDDRVEKSIDYLSQSVGPTTAPASLSWAIIGLTAHNQRPPQAVEWIEEAFIAETWRPLSSYESALLLLAANPAVLHSSPSLG